MFSSSHHDTGREWTELSPQNAYVEALTPNVTVFGHGFLKR